MQKSQRASVDFTMRWESAYARHSDRMFVERIDFWRDLLPGTLDQALDEAHTGDVAEVGLGAGELDTPFQQQLVKQVPAARLNRRLGGRVLVEPHVGRFYPRALLAGVGDIYPQDRRPFRYLGADGDCVYVDLNNPMARFPVRLTARITERLPAAEEHGGRCNDVAHQLAEDGPGLQAALPDQETDFYSSDPFARSDERDDQVFYTEPRFVNHLDATALAQVSALYARVLEPGMRVLDLMSSWNSHVADDLAPLQVSGLGMNADELARNPHLTDYVVHDLNTLPRLPYESASFDAAICTVSVEYLTRPFSVFREVARVLRPGAPFAVTFSNRWFPPKVVRIWQELHPFERIALVVDYFRKSGRFQDMHTESVRGLPRPSDDKYAHQLAFSDPVFAVWGYVQPAH